MKNIWILVTALCLICLILIGAVIYEHHRRPIVISPYLQPYTYIQRGDYLEWSQSKWSGQPATSDVTVVFDNGISPCAETAIVVHSSGNARCKVTAPYGYYSYTIQPGIVNPPSRPEHPWQGGPCKPYCPPPIVVGSTQITGPHTPDQPATLTAPPYPVTCNQDTGVASVTPAQASNGDNISWVPAGPNYGVKITFTADGKYPCGAGTTTLAGFQACTVTAPAGTQITYTVHEDSCVDRNRKNHDTTNNQLTIK